MYWSGGGSSNISDKETEVISGLIRTVGALIIISSSSVSPCCTASKVSSISFSKSSVAMSSIKSANVSISLGNLSTNERPMYSKEYGYFILIAPIFYVTDIPFEFLPFELLNPIYTIILPYLCREIFPEFFLSISGSVREIRLFLCTDLVEGHLIYPIKKQK